MGGAVYHRARAVGRPPSSLVMPFELDRFPVEGHFTLDLEGRVLTVDPEAAILLGVAPESIVGRPLPTVLDETRRAKSGGDGVAVTTSWLVNIDEHGALVLVREPRSPANSTSVLLQQRDELARIAQFMDGLLGELRTDDLERRMARQVATSLEATAALVISTSLDESGLRVSGTHGRPFASLAGRELRAPSADLPPSAALGEALGEELGLDRSLALVAAPLGTRHGRFLLVAVDPVHLRANPDARAEAADFLASVSNPCALALEEAALRRIVDAAERRKEIIRELSQAMARSLVPTDVWEAFAARIEGAIEHDVFALVLVEPDASASLWLAPSRGAASIASRAVDVAPASLVARAMAANFIVVAHDVGASENPGDKDLAALGCAAAAAVPLVAGAHAMGALVVGRRHAGVFSADELRLLELAASHLAPSLANARAFQDVSALHARVDRLSKAKDTMAALLVHDLRSPLSVALMNLDKLDRQSDNADLRRSTSVARRALSSATDQLTMLLDLAALEDDKLPCVRAPIELAAFVDHVVSPLGERLKAKGVRLKLSFDVQEFAADERLLRRALTNLVGNALEHVTEGGTVSVYVGDFGEGLRVAVDNDGPSVPPNLVPTLFTKYGRLSARREGYGLGLYFVKLASEAQGGHAFYESPAGGGARFGFTLARAPA